MAKNDSNDRRELLKKIQESDFYAFDLQLYLNTHPNCTRALQKYHQAINEGNVLRSEYESLYGPITASASSPLPPWQWIENPWTWERSK